MHFVLHAASVAYGSMMMSSGSGSGSDLLMPMNGTMNDTLMPMNSSGSGSGSGQSPMITNCPVSIPAVSVVPQLGQFSVSISIMLTAMDNDNSSSIVFSVMNPMQGVISNATIESDGSSLLFMINGDSLNSVAMPMSEFNVTIFASDGLSNSEPCITVVTIQYQVPSECVAARTPQQQSTDQAERQINAIYIPVQQSPSDVSSSNNIL